MKMNFSKVISMLLLCIGSSILFAQTPGMIFIPQGGMGVTPLNPNGDAWSSLSINGYQNNDLLESDIIYKPLPVTLPEPTSDLIRGADCFFSDIVRSNAYDAGVYMYYDGTNLLFRFRQGGTVPGSKGYSILLDTDQKFGAAGETRDPNYLPKTTGINGNPGFEVEIVLETNFRVAVYNVDGIESASTAVATFPYNTHHQRSVALTNNCNDPDYFHDFYIPFSALSSLGVTASTPLRIAATTVMAGKGAIGGPISDINGGNTWEDVINNQSAFTIASGPTFNPVCTKAPTVTGPISPSASSIVGTWTRLDANRPATATIEIYKNNVLIGSTTASSGVGWSFAISGLVDGDRIYAMAQATGESKCLKSDVIRVSNCNVSNSTATPVITCATRRGIEGTSVPNATISIIRYDAAGQTIRATLTADGTGNWGWAGEGSTGNSTSVCSTGGSDVNDGSFVVTALAPSSSCPSAISNMACVTDGLTTMGDFTGSTALPTINQNPIYTAGTTISGTATASSLVRLYINGFLQSTTTASGGNYSFTGLNLVTGDSVRVTAQANLMCADGISRRVVCYVAPPKINANDRNRIQTGTIIAGTSTEPSGTVVSIYNAGTMALLGTATVQANGTWTSSISAVAATNYLATQSLACGTSANSNTVNTMAATPSARCGSFTGTPYNETITSVAGSLSSGVSNTKVYLYLDGELIDSLTTSSTSWSIPVNTNANNSLYAGATLKFTVAEPGTMATVCPASVTITCNAPAIPTIPTTVVTVYNAPGNAAFTVTNTTANVLYALEDKLAPFVDYAASKFSAGTGTSLTLNSFPFTVAGTYNLKISALTFAGVGCVSSKDVTVIVPDAGRDGVPDYMDIDDDDDGIPDVVEACGLAATDFSCIGGDPTADNDNDGIPNYRDPDFCVLNVWGVCAILDADGDGIINQFDLDSDNDGIPDLVESFGVSTTGSGVIEAALNNDVDGDGLIDLYDNVCNASPAVCASFVSGNKLNYSDSDGDGIPDFLDLDSDNDGIPDVIEAGGVDANGDGRIDNFVDTDNDGFHDVVDGDVGNDGVAENTSRVLIVTGPDTNNNGRPNSYLKGDFDGDGILNHVDLDADNDGIQDILEVYGVDADGDGRVDGFSDTDSDGWSQNVDGDTNNDGIIDNLSNVLITTGIDANNDGRPDTYPNKNADKHGLPNFLDLDSDNDGITDVVENAAGMTSGASVTDNPASGVLDGFIGVGPIMDANGNGWYDNKESSIEALDSDGDGIPDAYDIDADNDGIPDYLEGTCSTCPNFGLSSTEDTNGNGVLDIFENLTAANLNGGSNIGLNPNEDDNDGTLPVDYLDLDSDKDGSLDWLEGFDIDGNGSAKAELLAIAANYVSKGGPATDYPNTDSDGDGLPDWLDNLPFGHLSDLSQLPPFLNPASIYWIDRDQDGLADLLDNNINGNTWGTLTTVPDKDGINDRDWRDATTSIDLPVEMFYFKVLRKDAFSVKLDWATASELNNNGFIIERMLDHEKAFSKVGFVAGTGSTSQTSYYDFTDQNSYGKLSYYRLKQVDYDGNYQYSIIKAVEGVAHQISISVFPNPSTDIVYLRLGSIAPAVKKLKLELSDALGHQLYQWDLEAKSYDLIDLQEFKFYPKGVYYLKMTFDNGIMQTEQIIIK